MKKFLIVGFLIMLCGCASEPKVKLTHMKLVLGMSPKTVINAMGLPPEREVYKQRNDTIVEFLIYPNFTPLEEKTAIGFIDNKLAGWGKTFYEDHTSGDIKRIK